jgi:hypothetical protein
MRDLESRLGAGLAGIAEGAPGADGLAGAARRRYRRRRQRRAVVGAVAVVLAVGAGAFALARPAPRADHVTTPSGGSEWQTIRQGDALAAVPGDWRQADCNGVTVWAAADPCRQGAGFLGSATYDAQWGPAVIGQFPDGHGPWTGYVYVGQRVLSVSDHDRDLVREILASARLEGEPVVDGSRWTGENRGVVSYEIPAGWGVPPGDRAGYTACVALANEAAASEEQVDARTFRSTRIVEGFAVTVVAPTRAVADLVLGSVIVHPTVSRMDRCAEGGSDVVTVEADGVTLEVPPTWQAHSCGGIPQFAPGPECRRTNDSEGVQFLLAATYQPAMGEGELVRSGTVWGGYVWRGKYAVLITAPDRDLVAELLTKVR